MRFGPHERDEAHLKRELGYLEDLVEGEVRVDEIPFSEPVMEPIDPDDLEEGEEVPPMPKGIPTGNTALVSNAIGLKFQRRLLAWWWRVMAYSWNGVAMCGNIIYGAVGVYIVMGVPLMLLSNIHFTEMAYRDSGQRQLAHLEAALEQKEQSMPDSDLDAPPGKEPLSAEELAASIHLPMQARDSP